MVEGPNLYKLPYFGSSKIFVTGVFLRLRNHILDGHISGLEHDRDNLKPLLRTKSPTPYRLVPLPSRSRFCPYTYPGAGGQYEIDNISGYVARRFTKMSGIVAGDEPGALPEDFRHLTKGN